MGMSALNCQEHRYGLHAGGSRTVGRMSMRQLDPRVRMLARVMSIRHVGNPLVRGIDRIVLRNFPVAKVNGVKITRACRGFLHIYDPGVGGVQPGLLWIHGGGLVVGSVRQDDGLCARTAATLGAVVVSVDYRLAPEHPYPAAIDDVFLAWRWVLAHAFELFENTEPARALLSSARSWLGGQLGAR